MHRLIAVLMLMTLATTACSGIPQQVEVRSDEMAVVIDTQTGDLGAPLLPGTHTINAMTQEVVFYPTFAQNYTFSGLNSETQPMLGAPPLQATAGDGTQLEVDISIVFRLRPDAINAIHATYTAQGEDVRSDYVNPTTQNVVQQVFSGYMAADIIDTRQREVAALMEVDLRRLFENAGLTLDRITLHAVRRAQ